MMGEIEDSCLVQKMSHYVDLDAASRAHLSRLEGEERSFAAQKDVRRVGDPIENLYVVKKGWVYTSIDMHDGRRQIVKLHHPGDIVGMADLAFKSATAVLRTAEPTVLCPFPRKHLDIIFRESPRLTALLFTLALRDQISVTDLLRAMGRMSARERMAYLLLDLRARLKITNLAMTDTVRMPLTQAEIGDLLGLTNVYVSRTLTGLEADGYIQRTAGHIRLLRTDELTAMCDFVDRHATIETNWFPNA